ncbi:MAG TPA: universal stress protein [Sphingomicrobium sp.]|nr:universal stress protein [Sphingomicrobium sp.]
MHRILVATDFSTRSDRALGRASLIARQVNVPLTLVHVVDGDQSERLIDTCREAALSLLSEMSATMGEAGLDVDWRVKVDDPYAGIQSAAEELDADLIVIGPHRRRLRDIFVGTTAERIVHRSTYPLLIAVEPPSGRHGKTLLAMDFDAGSKSAARKALSLGLFDLTDVTIMHAFDAPAEGMMRRALMEDDEVTQYVASEGATADADLRSLAEELGLPPATLAVVAMKGTPARTIFEAARQAGSDLIVLGTNQRKGFERVLVGSVTAEVIRDAQRDVLIVPVDADV